MAAVGRVTLAAALALMLPGRCDWFAACADAERPSPYTAAEEVDRAVQILAREASCARAAQTVGIAAVGTSAKSVVSKLFANKFERKSSLPQ